MLKYTYIWVSDTAMLDMDYDFEYRERASVAGPCHVHRNVSRNVLECERGCTTRKNVITHGGQRLETVLNDRGRCVRRGAMT